MKAPRKKINLVIIVVAVIALVPFGLYLFRPFASTEYDFAINKKAVEEKEKFIASAVSIDSTVRKPNIIILVADDLGKTDISLYGSPFVHTPNIDSLAIEGVKFTNGYVTAAVCSPSR